MDLPDRIDRIHVKALSEGGSIPDYDKAYYLSDQIPDR